MRMLKKISVCILIVLSVVLYSVCSNFDNNERTKLKYYTADKGDAYDALLIKQYNKFCLENYDESYQIEIISFENEDDMNTKISTEIMAGKGPDIITLNQTLPFEKMIDNKSFLNINKLNTNNEIDFNDYNSVVMDAGVYNGQRYIIPLSFGMNVLMSTKEKLNQFNISLDNGTPLTYNDIDSTFSNFFSAKTSFVFISNDNESSMYDNAMQLFGRFINSYVDFENKTSYFDNEEFSTNVETMKQLVKNSDKDTYDTLFDDLNILNSLPTVNYSYYSNKLDGETKIVCRGLSKNKEDYSGYMEMGFAINANTKLKDQAYAFIKYALSEESQTRLCGLDKNHYWAGITLPVNNKVYEKSKKSQANKAMIMASLLELKMNSYLNI